MREIPRAPTRFSGTLDDLYEQHAKHVLIDKVQVTAFHNALMDYLKTDDPIYLIRKVTGLERGKTVRNESGCLIRATDNAPAWHVHHELFTSSFTSNYSFTECIDSIPCHMFSIKIPAHINIAGWHVAHIFDVNNGDVGFHKWNAKELRRRMVRNIHPCNYFYIPGNDWQAYGGREEVLAFFQRKLSKLYDDIWDDLLDAADAEPTTYYPSFAQFEYSISAASKTISSEQKKNRMTFRKAWLDQGIRVTFTNEGITYRYPHDEFLNLLINQLGIIKGTKCWEQDGIFHFPKLSRKQRELLKPYIIE
jgi:hypothetical protein